MIDNDRLPVADRDPAARHGQQIADLNDPMWSDAQRAHAQRCTELHVGAGRCRRLDVPDLAVECVDLSHQWCLHPEEELEG